jgi:hypothetical protein
VAIGPQQGCGVDRGRHGRRKERRKERRNGGFAVDASAALAIMSLPIRQIN